MSSGSCKVVQFGVFILLSALTPACGILDTSQPNPYEPFERQTPRVGRYKYSTTLASGTLLIRQASADTIRYSWDVRSKQDTTAVFEVFDQVGPYNPVFVVNSYEVGALLSRSDTIISSIVHYVTRDGEKMNCSWLIYPNNVLALAPCSLVYFGPL